MRAPKLTRRSFLKTAAAGSAVAATVGILAGCTHEAQEESEEPVVVDEDSAEDVLSSYEEAESTLTVENSWSLPLGNVLHPGEGTWIPVTTAGASATPMLKASALSLASGELLEVVPEPIGKQTTTVIYDARCSDSVYAWLELDYVTRAWSLYAAPFADGAISGETVTLSEGDANYDPAPFAVSGSTVIWQQQPSAGGEKTSEHSFCYLWHAGDTQAKAVVESFGRFATTPQVSGGAVILAPRVRSDSVVFYGVTAYSLADDLETQLGQLVMPQNVRPFRATRVGERFLVSVEASYSTGGLLGQMGTYIGTAESGFARINREPSECGCGHADLFIVKSNASYLAVDLAKHSISSLPSADRIVDYGEYPARAGECDLFVTFSTVKDATTGYPASVAVRTFRL